MAVTWRLTVENIDTIIATYTKIEIERSSSPGSGFSEIAEVTLVADDTYYSYEDSGGSSSSYYRHRFSNAAETTRSDYSPVYRVGAATRLRIRQRAISDYRCGLVLTNNAAASTTSVTTTDYRFDAAVYQANRGKGGYLHPSSGAEAGNTRIITATTPSGGVFTHDRAWGTGLASGDQFEWHWFVDPDIWNDAINRALRRYRRLDYAPIIGVTDDPEYDLDDLWWLRSLDDILTLEREIDDTHPREPWGIGGRWWSKVQDAAGFKIRIYPTIDTTDTIWLGTLRPMPELYNDSDEAPADCDEEYAAALAYDEVLNYMLQPGYGAAEDPQSLLRAKALLGPKLKRLAWEHKIVVPLHPKQLPNPPRTVSTFSAR